MDFKRLINTSALGRTYNHDDLKINVDNLVLKDPDEVTKEILDFLKQITEENRKTSIRQFRSNLLLTILVIIITALPIILNYIDDQKSQDILQNQKLTKLIEIQEEQNKLLSETIYNQNILLSLKQSDTLNALSN
ncbi:hypothetical protein [Nonlabens tegetincola]|uniref:hypothetical protein n=1 Tax=Nonlabens tegetincola TaxID=323273 RepID=UPI0005A61DC9|nr:hypothetical protein [Nonlabens tegetincola]